MSTPLPMINLAIVDESPLTRLGIEQFVLSLNQNICCSVQATSAEQLQQDHQDTPFDLIICELTGAQEVERAIDFCQSRPEIRQIIYTYTRCGELLHKLLRFPQVCIISRQETPEQISDCFLQALDGIQVCSPVAQQAIDQHLRESGEMAQQLTVCEQEVLEYVFRGISLSHVAIELQRSVKTLSAHKRNAMRKLGVDTDAELFSLKQRFATH